MAASVLSLKSGLRICLNEFQHQRRTTSELSCLRDYLDGSVMGRLELPLQGRPAFIAGNRSI